MEYLNSKEFLNLLKETIAEYDDDPDTLHGSVIVYKENILREVAHDAQMLHGLDENDVYAELLSNTELVDKLLDKAETIYLFELQEEYDEYEDDFEDEEE